MFVYFLTGETGEIQRLPRVQHGLRERGRLSAAQTADPGRHQPRRYLVIGNFSTRIPRNQKLDFFAGMFAGVAFFSDQIDSAHAVGCVRGSVTSSHLQVNAPRHAPRHAPSYAPSYAAFTAPLRVNKYVRKMPVPRNGLPGIDTSIPFLTEVKCCPHSQMKPF